MPVDWTGLAGVIMGTLIILIPVAGLTARFAFKPIVEAIAHLRQTPQANDRLAAIESRLALLETQMDNTETELARLSDESEFRRKLSQGGES
ncbi:MAG: hypothetical protein Q8W51_11655 [Candidatus Palauibacterales bacterium]|jgi:hypothetical protein|nr:hypothetical protein [Candidatus Palauibacterales bacterium]MDP2530377.1 hypothetical protein [Candidatus Palauibacterales bacterium]MDP2585063.1 hypothetical protein [Candidatus Palauibacterales bacterium]